MARTGARYNRGQRSYDTETDFTMGMMYTEGIVDGSYVRVLNNFDVDKQERSLTPRKGLVTTQLKLHEVTTTALENVEFCNINNKVSLQGVSQEISRDGAMKEQFVILDETHDKLNLITGSGNKVLRTGTNSIPANVLRTNGSVFKDLPTPSEGMASVIGTFATGNHYHCFDPVNSKVYYSEYNESADLYDLTEAPIKEPTASEAVTYGYNALLGDNTYLFKNSTLAAESIIQLDGILPYKRGTTELVMKPKAEEVLTFRLYHAGSIGKTYKLVWEWRLVGDQGWTPIVSERTAQPYPIQSDGSLQGDTIDFKPPHKDVLIRIQAINTANPGEVEKAITAGFDFKKADKDNLKQETYDLFKAQGMTAWGDQIVVYGVPKDPNILFVSAPNDPGYFPYPNNITVFDEPITAVKQYLDGLIVFTTSQMHIVKRADDGVNWTTEVVQNNLRIQPWDRHLIQVVKNMVFFKSGNYFFMMVPRTTSSTGELILAPISRPVTKFFDDFSKSVKDLLEETYDYKGDLVFTKVYNFLDYDDVHNMFVFKAGNKYITVACIYNVTDRSWRLNTFNTEGILYPYMNDSTQKGKLAMLTTHSYDISGTQPVTYTEEEYPVDPLALPAAKAVYIKVKHNTPTPKRGFIHLGNGPDPFVYYLDDSWTVRLDEIENTRDKRFNNVPAIFRGAVTEAEPNEILKTIEYNFPFTALPSNARITFRGIEYGLDNNIFSFTRNTTTGMWELTFKTDDLKSINDYLYDQERFKLKVTYTDAHTDLRASRVIQILETDSKGYKDKFVPSTQIFKPHDTINDLLLLYPVSVVPGLLNNFQFLDTGYRDRTSEHNKKYRELRMRINNISKKDLDFGLEFILDGDLRLGYWTSETLGTEGLVYLNGIAYTNVRLDYVPENDVDPNFWTLNQTEHPDQSIWWVKAPISGKGYAPRMKLLSRNQEAFSMSAITWVYRMMYVR